MTSLPTGALPIPIRALLGPRKDTRLTFREKSIVFSTYLAEIGSRSIPLATDVLEKTTACASCNAHRFFHDYVENLQQFVSSWSTAPRQARRRISRGGTLCELPIYNTREKRGRQPSGYQLKRCGRCYQAYYCSEACQIADKPRHGPYCKAKDPQTIDRDESFKRVRDIVVDPFFRILLGNYIRQTFRYGKAEEHPFRIRHFMFIFTLSFITDPFDSSKNIPQISTVEVCPKDISLLQIANDVTVKEATPSDIYKDFFDDPYIDWMIQTDDPAAPHRISCGMSMKYLDLWDDPVAGWLLRTQIIDRLDPDIGSLILLNLVIRKNKDRWRSSN